VPRSVPGPVPVVVVVLVAVLVLQVGSLARVALAHSNSYTIAADALASAQGDPCGLARSLSVETDPSAGLLVPRTQPAAPDERPVDVGGAKLPGLGVTGHRETAWFALDAARAGLPVVVTTAGTMRRGDSVALQFGRGRVPLSATAVATSATRDVRVLPPAGADSVRLMIDASTAGSSAPALVTLPRMPVLTPMEALLPRGTDAILDWPVAFVFPCLNPAPLPLGTATLAAWRVGTSQAEDSAGITYAPGFGGPFAAPRLLVTERRMATYLNGDPIRDAVQLYRWMPVEPLVTPRPVVTDRTVPGWAADGHARVPGLDPVGG
jgi:EmbC C-terminal domain